MNILQAIYRLFARQPDTAAIVEMEQPISSPVIRIDRRIQAIKAIAAVRVSYRPVPDDMYAGVSERTKAWLLTLDTSMLMLVNSATYSQLWNHIAGRKAIRGLLAADTASVAAYKEALRPKISLADIDGRRGGSGGSKRSMGGMKL